MRILRSLLLATVAAFSLHALASSAFALDAYALLKDAGNAKNKPAFTGIQKLQFFKEGKNLSERIQFFFAGEKSFKAEILDPPDLKGTMFGRSGDMFNVYVPKFRFKMNQPIDEKDRGVAAQGDNLYIVGNWDVFKKNYAVSFVKNETFLKLPVHKITITNKHSSFVKRHLWIDTKSHVLLKEERYFNGKLYYDSAYEKIQFKKPSAKALEVNAGGKGINAPNIKRSIYTNIKEAKPHFPFPPFYPSKLPPGFVFKDARVRESMFGKDVIFIFTDGLHVVRLEERKGGLLSGLGGLLRGLMEKFQDYSPANTVKKDHEGYEISATGELPASMLEEMLRTLKPL